MSKPKKSGPAIFMYTVIAITLAISLVAFWLYYSGKTASGSVLWTGVVAFMIMYHLWVRIIMGNVSGFFKVDHNHWWFKERFFEPALYRFLRVKKWKRKVLTYNPESFSLGKNSLESIVYTMTKSELDHWINQLISISAMFFGLLWGQTWIFVVTSLAAMIFDAQFIVVQRYNRPKVLRLIDKKARLKKQVPQNG